MAGQRNDDRDTRSFSPYKRFAVGREALWLESLGARVCGSRSICIVISWFDEGVSAAKPLPRDQRLCGGTAKLRRRTIVEGYFAPMVALYDSSCLSRPAVS